MRTLERRYFLPFLLVSTLFLLWGLANNMTDTLLSAFKKVMQMSDTETSLIQFAFYGSYFCFALPAALFIKRFSYKTGILLGLLLYAGGAVLFYPAALAESYAFYLVAIYILAGGCSVLETTANPYILSMGSPETATRRLNIAQSFNPIGCIMGILLSRHFILRDISLFSISRTYLVLGLVLTGIMCVMAFSRMPTGKDSEAGSVGASFRRLLRNKRYVWGVVAQFFYVGAQIGVWSFTIRLVMQELGIGEKDASTYYLASIVCFCTARFFFTWLMKFFRPTRLMSVAAAADVVLCLVVILMEGSGMLAVTALILISFFMSLQFPTIYGTSLEGVGDDAKIGASGLIMAILGGAVLTPLQGMVSDAYGVSMSFVVPLFCFLVVMAYSLSQKRKRVFVSGCYDLLHSGHVEFFRQAAGYGDLYVGIGSDSTILKYKNHKTFYPERERLFMVQSIRYVKKAFINAGSGVMDFVPTVSALKPDRFVVNADGASEEKKRFCKEHGIEYIVLERTPADGLDARSSTGLKAQICQIPTRLDLAGTWIDQPYVSQFSPGWALTISLVPDFEVRERCGLSTSTRKQIQKIWPVKLPDMDAEMLAKLVFCFENDPERSDGIISGAQDSIGICVPGLCRHHYDARYWPDRIEQCQDEQILSWLESHLCLVPMFPRRPGCSVVEGKDITEGKVKALAKAADDCWNAIMQRDLQAFASAYQASFDAQIAMFPAMLQPGVQEYIDRYSALPDVLAWKMPGAGGGGYLALVTDNAKAFCNAHAEAIPLTIRR